MFTAKLLQPTWRSPAPLIRRSHTGSESKAGAEMILKGTSKATSFPQSRSGRITSLDHINVRKVRDISQSAPEYANSEIDVVPQFIILRRQRKPLLLHGHGQHSRCYLYAGDAAVAFEAILHKGEIGQIYTVDSRDEFSDTALTEELLILFGPEDRSS